MKNKIILIAGSSLTRTALDLLGSIILARALLPSGVGQISLITALSIFHISIYNLGLGQANIYLINAKNNEESNIIQNSIAASALTGLISAISIFIILKNFEGYFGKITYPCIIIYSIATALTLSNSILQPILIAKMRVHLVSALDISLSGISLTTYTLIYLLQEEILTVDLALTIQSSSKILISLLTIKILAKNISPIAKFHRHLLISSIKTGSRFYFTFIANQINTHLALFFMQKNISDLAQIGLYSRAMSLTLLLTIAPLAIGPILYSRWSLTQSNKNIELIKAIRITIILSAIAIPVLTAISEHLMSAIYGANFAPGAIYFNVLLVGTAFKITTDPITNYLASIEKIHLSGLAIIAGAALTTVLSFIFIPKWGGLGAALVFTTSQLAILLISFYILRKNGVITSLIISSKKTSRN